MNDLDDRDIERNLFILKRVKTDFNILSDDYEKKFGVVIPVMKTVCTLILWFHEKFKSKDVSTFLMHVVAYLIGSEMRNTSKTMKELIDEMVEKHKELFNA